MNYFTHWHDKSLWTHWGRVTHICVGNLTIIGPDNDLSPGRRQAIIRTNAGILLIEPLRANFSEISIEIHTFSFKEMHLIMPSGKWRPFCLGLSVKSSGLIRKHIWNNTSTEILRQHAKHWLPNWEFLTIYVKFQSYRHALFSSINIDDAFYRFVQLFLKCMFESCLRGISRNWMYRYGTWDVVIFIPRKCST